MTTPFVEEKKQLAQMVAKTGLLNVLDALAGVCDDQADSVRGKGIDPTGIYTRWYRRARMIDAVAARINEEKSHYG